MLNSIELLVNDKALRLRMGIEARRRAEDIFSAERTTDRMAELFMSARSHRE
jgi:glycosyltransferase involved in cell wall biosynthesis